MRIAVGDADALLAQRTERALELAVDRVLATSSRRAGRDVDERIEVDDVLDAVDRGQVIGRRALPGEGAGGEQQAEVGEAHGPRGMRGARQRFAAGNRGVTPPPRCVRQRWLVHFPCGTPAATDRGFSARDGPPRGGPGSLPSTESSAERVVRRGLVDGRATAQRHTRCAIDCAPTHRVRSAASSSACFCPEQTSFGFRRRQALAVFEVPPRTSGWFVRKPDGSWLLSSSPCRFRLTH